MEGQVGFRTRVNKAFFHPPAPGGAPLWLSLVNGLCAALVLGVFRFWYAAPLFVLIQVAFALVRRKMGPYGLRYLLRAVLRPILYLDS